MGQPAGLHKIGLPAAGANTNGIIAKQVYTRLFWFVDRSCACNYDSGPCKSTQLFILYVNRAFNRLGFWMLMLRTPIFHCLHFDCISVDWLQWRECTLKNSVHSRAQIK